MSLSEGAGARASAAPEPTPDRDERAPAALLLWRNDRQPDADRDWWGCDVWGVSVLERQLVAIARAGIARVRLWPDPGLEVRTFLGSPELHPEARALEIEVSGPGARPTHSPDLVLDAAFLVSANLLEHALTQPDPCTFEGPAGVPTGVSRGLPAVERSVLPVPDSAWSERVDTADGRRRAGARLMANLSKSTDGWFSLHLNRPLSTRITRCLAPYEVSPDLVTFVTLLVGLASGLASALGTALGFALGGVLFQAASMLDGVDGELARLGLRETPRGEWLDTICDDVTNLVYLAGVTVGTWHALASPALLTIGGTAMLLDVLVVGFLYWRISTRLDGRSLLAFQPELDRPELNERWTHRVARTLQPLVRRDAYGVAFMLFGLANAAWLSLVFTAIALTITLPAVVSMERRLLAEQARKGSRQA